MRGNWDYRGRLGVGRSPLDPPIPPRGPVTLPTPPRWWLRLWKSSPETSGKAYSEAARPRRTGQQPLAGSSGPEAAGPGPARCPVPGARGRTRDPYHEPLPGWRPGCSGLPPPPGVLPASSSGTSRHRLLRETRVPKSHSRRLQPAFQAAPDPQLPLQAGSHFRPAPAELAEVRRAGNGRTRALASGGWGWGGGAGGAGSRRWAGAKGAGRRRQQLCRPRPKGRQGLGHQEQPRRGLWETPAGRKRVPALLGPQTRVLPMPLTLSEKPLRGVRRECSRRFWIAF